MGLQSREQVRRERAAGGALNFSGEKLDSKVVSISCAIGDRFQFRFDPADPIISPKSTSLEEVAQIVWLGISTTDSGRPAVQPADVDRCRAALQEIFGSRAMAVTLDQSMNSLIPMTARRSAWRRLQAKMGIRLPRLGASPAASKAAVALGIILTYAIVIPLAKWSDETHPIHDPPFLLRMAAKVVVRGGFFVLLILLIVVLRGIGSLIFPGFPEGCGTLSELSLFSAVSKPPGESTRGWTLEEVRDHVRDIVAKVERLPADSIDMKRALAG